MCVGGGGGRGWRGGEWGVSSRGETWAAVVDQQVERRLSVTASPVFYKVHTALVYNRMHQHL